MQQRDILLEVGVGYLQGYLVGKPQPLHEIDWYEGYRSEGEAK